MVCDGLVAEQGFPEESGERNRQTSVVVPMVSMARTSVENRSRRLFATVSAILHPQYMIAVTASPRQA